MDYQEEQSNEIEALDSIYCGELEILSSEPHVFTIPIKSDDYEEGQDNGIICKLKFEYNADYPDSVPLIEIESSENIEDSDSIELLDYLLEEARENLGTVMVFTLVSAAQEWINLKSDEMKKTKELAEVEKLKKEEEEERKRFEGTLVTVESFLQWKTAFDLEMGYGIIEKGEKNKKLTGRELFMTDKSLIESDLKFLEEGGEYVKVDESLFQDLEDLDIDSEIALEDDD